MCRGAVWAVACLLPSFAPATAQERGPFTATELFAFHNDLRVNLHHFLVNWASAEDGRRPRYAPPLREREQGLEALTSSDRDAWTRAVAAYRRAVGRSYIFDEGMVAVRDAAAGIAPPAAVPADDRVLLEALDEALDVYRTYWWPAHQERNRAWIAGLVPVLKQVEGGIARRLEAAYGGTWPEEPVRVDVVFYANYDGAYSIGGVATVSSGDEANRMPQAVEIIFHESSHTDPLELSLRELIARAFSAEGLEAPDRLWHDVIFYTTGEATRLEFARQGLGNYRHYGSFGVYRRGERWTRQLAALGAAWRPFLESERADVEARHRAMQSVARALEAGL
jgi:hypothetical protein